MPKGWDWDETLYLGTAPFYARGRLPYAPALAERLADALTLDGTGRLIDVGCGPGILALLLAHLFDEVTGVDPDPGMLAEGERLTTAAGIANARWLRALAEDLTGDVGRFRVATFGQSFHWMEQERVAAIMLGILGPGGALVHVSDVKSHGRDGDHDLRFPMPPIAAIRTLIEAYLGPIRRAGQGLLRFGSSDGEAAILSAAGFAGPDHLRIPAAGVITRDADDIVAWGYSLSGSAPHLFGSRLGEFERELRDILVSASPDGLFSEQLPDTEVFVWRKP